MLKIIKLCMTGFIALVIVACVAGPSAENTGEYLDSSAVTSNVKTQLVDKLGAQGFLIKVKTYRDEVQLSGRVDNAMVRQKARAIAASVEGVKHVRNDLIVK